MTKKKWISVAGAAIFLCMYGVHYLSIDGIPGWIICFFDMFGTAETTVFSQGYTLEKYRQITRFDNKETVGKTMGIPMLVSVTTGVCSIIVYEDTGRRMYAVPTFSESWDYSVPRFTDHSGVLYRLRRVVFDSHGNVRRTETGIRRWEKIPDPASQVHPGDEPIGDSESIPMIDEGFRDGQRSRRGKNGK